MYTAAVLLALAFPDSAASIPSIVASAVRIDSVHEQLVVSAGPFPNCATKGNETAPERPSSARFAWKVNAYLRGFRVELHDRDKRPLSRDHLRYAGVANMARREFLYPQLQRLFAAGGETDAVTLPSFLGVPIGTGDSLLMYVCIRAEPGETTDGATITLFLDYTPRRRFFRPLSILPWHIDVNFVPGQPASYDLPPGHSSRTTEFTPPMSILVLALGGHLRDYGTELRIVDCETGHTLVLLEADRRPDGTVKSVGRFIFGFHGSALRLEAGHRYRLIATYDNPTGHTIIGGAESAMAGPIVPVGDGTWPPLHLNDKDVIADLASL